MAVYFSNISLQNKVKGYEKICEEALEDSKKISELNFREWLDSPWKGFFENRYGKVDLKMKKETGIDEETLNHIGNVSVPDLFDTAFHIVSNLLYLNFTLLA